MGTAVQSPVIAEHATVWFVRILYGLILFSGCGPSFTGTWHGSISSAIGCDDGSGRNETLSFDWSVIERGSVLDIAAIGGGCGAFEADIVGNIATLRSKNCPVAGPVVSDRIQGGTLTLYATGIMRLCLEETTGFANGDTCDDNSAGNLTRMQ